MTRKVLVFLGAVVVAFVASLSAAKAQSVQTIEDQVRFYLDRIYEYPSVSKKLVGGDYDSLEYYNKSLRAYLKEMLVREPHTLEYGFNKLGWRMTIATSKDKKFRIYSWDEQGGGAAHKYSSVLQYIAGDQVRVLEFRSGSFYFTKVFQVTAKNTRTYYLAERKGMHSNTIHTEGIQCFAVENDAINNSVELFDSNSELLNSIDVEIDWAVSDTKRSEIQFSADHKLIYFPLVIDRRVTNRYLIYQFDGEKFVYSKVGKN